MPHSDMGVTQNKARLAEAGRGLFQKTVPHNFIVVGNRVDILRLVRARNGHFIVVLKTM